MRIAYDMSSVCWTSLLVGKDAEGVEVVLDEKKYWVNSAEYGYENAVNLMLSAMEEANCVPSNIIMVVEGLHSKKRRTMISAEYKANRGTRPLQQNEQFNKLLEMLVKAFKDRGAIAVTQDYVEGDDVLAWLAENSEEDLRIVTNDNDLVCLHGKNAYGANISVRVGGVLGKNKYGPFDLKLVTLYKTLVGDSSDNIKGAQGFGPKAFEACLLRYDEDGLEEILKMIQEGRKDDLAVIAEDNNCKHLRKIAEEWNNVQISYRLALLHPEWVNTVRQPLVWSPGMVVADGDDSRLLQYRGQTRLVGSANFDAALDFLKLKMGESEFVAFDIETSTCDESTDWCEQSGVAVDVIGSYLVGFSLTFGRNSQYTYYVSVKHADSDNITMMQARQMLEAVTKTVVVHNLNFELPVLALAADEDGTLWKTLWKDNGFEGFLPNCLDTKFEASYVNENIKNGLKGRSLEHLKYTQETYEQNTELEGKPFAGGHPIKLKSGVLGTRYKMHELPASHVCSYGADDSIVTAALHNFFKLHMQLDHHWHVYLDVEIDAAYLHAQSFVHGVKIDTAMCKALEKEDDLVFDKAWGTLREFLIEHGWAGTVAPDFVGQTLDAKAIKQAYAIVTGQDAEPEEPEEGEEVEEIKDVVLSSRVRTPAKLVALIESTGEDVLAAHLAEALKGDATNLQKYVHSRFTGEPKFKSSNKQLCNLFYNVMDLPVKVFNAPTAKMKAEGRKQGNPKTDALAFVYAELDAKPEQKEVLNALKLMQMVRTRRSFYYSKYPHFVHWKTGKVHSSHNQCGTNTRRASSAGPNLQQLPKHPKIEGYVSKFRSVIAPHKKNAVVVSMDIVSQELVVIGDYSKDKNMLDCFVGEHIKDMHTLTGSGIAAKKDPKYGWTYEILEAALKDPNHEKHKEAKGYRTLGKKLNFTAEYLAAAEKVSQTLIVSKEDAQDFLDARESVFSGATAWKKGVIEEAKKNGFVLTKLGAKRHLAELLNSEDRYIASKADRQAVNFKIQSSSAEMTKKAEGRMWQERLEQRFDCEVIGPIHDEVVISCAVQDLPSLLPAMHACMVAQYADMQVPVRSSVSFGRNFFEQLEVGEAYDDVRVKKALSELGFTI